VPRPRSHADSDTPKYAVAQMVGYIKGKSAIAIARNHCVRKRNYAGESFWARDYYVSTVGRDEEAIGRYISKQEAEDNQFEQREMFTDRRLPNDRFERLTNSSPWLCLGSLTLREWALCINLC